MDIAMIAIVTVTLLSAILGLILGYAAIRFRVEGNPLADQVEKVLPQSQCGQCGFAGCKGYAKALTEDNAEINLCPPGGQTVVVALADLLGRDLPNRKMVEKSPAIAIIEEPICIGCTLCRQACPVDAIVGAAKQIHTVLREECTGCELCLAPCPVACITMVPVAQELRTWKWPHPVIPLHIDPQRSLSTVSTV